jgi:DNA-binding NarL/FixJ family response regulator
MSPTWSARPATPLVLLAGDRSLSRKQLGPALAARGFALCAMVSDAPAAVRAAVQYRPDACIVDIDIPGQGVRALREIRARLPECAVVIVSRQLDERELFAALRAGAVGYLPSDMDPQRLSHTLARVLEGEVAIPRAFVARLVEEFRDGHPHRRSLLLDEPTQLTSREWQVLDLLRDGHSTSEIARRLVLSPVTVRTHINAIVHKLGYAGRDELLRDFSPA